MRAPIIVGLNVIVCMFCLRWVTRGAYVVVFSAARAGWWRLSQHAISCMCNVRLCVLCICCGWVMPSYLTMSGVL